MVGSTKSRTKVSSNKEAQIFQPSKISSHDNTSITEISSESYADGKPFSTRNGLIDSMKFLEQAAEQASYLASDSDTLAKNTVQLIKFNKSRHFSDNIGETAVSLKSRHKGDAAKNSTREKIKATSRNSDGMHSIRSKSERTLAKNRRSSSQCYSGDKEQRKKSGSTKGRMRHSLRAASTRSDDSMSPSARERYGSNGSRSSRKKTRKSSSLINKGSKQLDSQLKSTRAIRENENSTHSSSSSSSRKRRSSRSRRKSSSIQSSRQNANGIKKCIYVPHFNDTPTTGNSKRKRKRNRKSGSSNRSPLMSDSISEKAEYTKQLLRRSQYLSSIEESNRSKRVSQNKKNSQSIKISYSASANKPGHVSKKVKSKVSNERERRTSNCTESLTCRNINGSYFHTENWNCEIHCPNCGHRWLYSYETLHRKIKSDPINLNSSTCDLTCKYNSPDDQLQVNYRGSTIQQNYSMDNSDDALSHKRNDTYITQPRIYQPILEELSEESLSRQVERSNGKQIHDSNATIPRDLTLSLDSLANEESLVHDDCSINSGIVSPKQRSVSAPIFLFSDEDLGNAPNEVLTTKPKNSESVRENEM